MNQYTMIEKAIQEHKRLSLISGARLLSLSIDISGDMERGGWFNLYWRAGWINKLELWNEKGIEL